MAMKCETCGGAADLVCGNCGAAAYCGKEHQRAHWPQHKPHCLPCTVQRSEQLGRFLAASRPVAAGTVLIKEWPLIVGPCAASRAVCWGCHCVSQAAHRCSRCGAPVCDNKCEQLASHSKWECRSLAPDRGAALALHQEVVLPLRCLLGVRSGAPPWTTFLELEAHLERRRGSPVWQERERGVIQVLKGVNVVAADGSEDELLQRICGILDVNSFEVRGPASAELTGEPLRAVFLRAALMAHSCEPTCQLAVDEQLQLTVRANRDLPRGGPVFYNYCDLLETTVRRQEHLSEGKYFECGCARCRDPTERGTYLSSLWCPRCLSGLLVPPAPRGHQDQNHGFKPLQTPERRLKPLPSAVRSLRSRKSRRPKRSGTGGAPWRCLQCGFEAEALTVLSGVARCSEAWQEVDRSDVDALEELLRTLSRTLAPHHALILAAKQMLVGLYRDRCLSPGLGPVKREAPRMQQLCQDILDVLEALLPKQVSRLKGIALHELHVALVLQGHAERARDQLQSALLHLQLEPPLSPEGRLHQLALEELATLEASLQEPPLQGRSGNKRLYKK